MYLCPKHVEHRRSECSTSQCVGVSVWLGWGGIRVAGLSHTETSTHIETRTHVQCGDTIEKSQGPDDGCIYVRNMLSIEEVK